MGRNQPGRRMQRREQRKREAEQQAREAAQPAAEQRRGGRRQPGTGSLRPRRKPAWRRTLDSFGGPMVVGAILLALVVVAGLIYLSGTGEGAGNADFEPRERTQADGRVLGSPDAEVRIVEFSDFQCPHCARFAQDTAPQVEEEFVEPGTAAVEFRHYAFLGEESVRAAEAAECANDQGRFWDYHDLLFLRQGTTPNSGAFSDSNLRSFARELQEHYPDFDPEAFDACLASGEKQTIVEDHTDTAADFGVDSTPTFLVDTVLIEGNQPIEVWRDVIESITGEATGGEGAGAGTPQG